MLRGVLHPSRFVERVRRRVERPYRRRRLTPESAHAGVDDKPHAALRLITWNLAHGRGPRQTHFRRRRLERNIENVARTVRCLEADIVALQEADGPSIWSGNFDHVATLAELAELDDHFRGDHNHWGSDRLNTGTALLARHPLLEPLSHRFGENWRDTKGFVVATIEVPQWHGHPLDVVSVHLDPLVPRIRQRQIAQMTEELSDRQNPLVLLGDLNCCFMTEPQSLDTLAEALSLEAFQPDSHSPTYPASRPVRRLDWILISSELGWGGYGTLPVHLSDHLLVTADLVLEEQAMPLAVAGG